MLGESSGCLGNFGSNRKVHVGDPKRLGLWIAANRFDDSLVPFDRERGGAVHHRIEIVLHQLLYSWS
ncbi:hypothetical protein SDC9_122840 [bioreactor metagenome]|uniref:Uncharacterized protein n=1 Tax=bioreactor metagenome TaxID=1076179 RepID=A0A645CFR4_9ZZZZ